MHLAKYSTDLTQLLNQILAHLKTNVTVPEFGNCILNLNQKCTQLQIVGTAIAWVAEKTRTPRYELIVTNMQYQRPKPMHINPTYSQKNYYKTPDKGTSFTISLFRTTTYLLY